MLLRTTTTLSSMQFEDKELLMQQYLSFIWLKILTKTGLILIYSLRRQPDPKMNEWKNKLGNYKQIRVKRAKFLRTEVIIVPIAPILIIFIDIESQIAKPKKEKNAKRSKEA